MNTTDRLRRRARQMWMRIYKEVDDNIQRKRCHEGICTYLKWSVNDKELRAYMRAQLRLFRPSEDRYAYWFSVYADNCCFTYHNAGRVWTQGTHEDRLTCLGFLIAMCAGRT